MLPSICVNPKQQYARTYSTESVVFPQVCCFILCYWFYLWSIEINGVYYIAPKENCIKNIDILQAMVNTVVNYSFWSNTLGTCRHQCFHQPKGSRHTHKCRHATVQGLMPPRELRWCCSSSETLLPVFSGAFGGTKLLKSSTLDNQSKWAWWTSKL